MKVKINGIDEVIKKIENYKKDLTEKQSKLVALLSARGYEIMVNEINSLNMPFSKGELIRGCSFDYGDTRATVYVISDHAIFVEFGTGITGAWSPHPDNKIGYVYDVNNHGYDGWYYTDETGKHWTRGMPSRAFVYITAQQLRDELIVIAKEVFKQ
ncbi:MAG: hypothetical protein HFF36_02570 [Coprobacillus sp.]|nr:hypothetical protein [Coprobacillus sp.]